MTDLECTKDRILQSGWPVNMTNWSAPQKAIQGLLKSNLTRRNLSSRCL